MAWHRVASEQIWRVSIHAPWLSALFFAGGQGHARGPRGSGETFPGQGSRGACHAGTRAASHATAPAGAGLCLAGVTGQGLPAHVLRVSLHAWDPQVVDCVEWRQNGMLIVSGRVPALAEILQETSPYQLRRISISVMLLADVLFDDRLCPLASATRHGSRKEPSLQSCRASTHTISHFSYLWPVIASICMHALSWQPASASVTLQAFPQRQPPRSFLGRVSATSFLDSVGGMIPGSGGENEPLPDGRVCPVHASSAAPDATWIRGDGMVP